MHGWAERVEALQAVARTQLFFIGGAPRSGTTWVQHILDRHPDISCRGEGLFMQHLAVPLDTLIEAQRGAIEAKNTELFAGFEGFPQPEKEDADILLGTAVLVSLLRQTAGRPYAAIGEKSPENVILFPRLKTLFPGAKIIVVARDPRNVLASAWHLWHKQHSHGDPNEGKRAMIVKLLPTLVRVARATLALRQLFPNDTMIVTYENLKRAPQSVVAQMFGFLGVAAEAGQVARAVQDSSFESMSRGRRPGETRDEDFLRKGVTGGWHDTLTDDMNTLILQQTAWMFPHFGWHPEGRICP